MGDEGILDEAICHTLRVKTAKVAAGTLSRLEMVRAGVTVSNAKCCRPGWSVCWQCWDVGHLRRYC